MVNENELGGGSEKPAEESVGFERTKMGDLTPDQIAQYQAYMQDNPEAPVVETKRESGAEILEFEASIDEFEKEFSVEDLMAITEVKEALESPLRKNAKDALGPILKKLQALEKETDISKEKLAELKARYKKLSNAVGIINSDKVDHAR